MRRADKTAVKKSVKTFADPLDLTSGSGLQIGPNGVFNGPVTFAADCSISTVRLGPQGSLSCENPRGWSTEGSTEVVTYMAPSDGYYDFSTAAISTAKTGWTLAIDGVPVVPGVPAGNIGRGGLWLARGPHVITRLIGLSYTIRVPGGELVTFPYSPLRADVGPVFAEGTGRLAPAADSILAVAWTNVLETPFSGALAAAPGGAVLKKGPGFFSSRWESGDLLVREGTLSVPSAAASNLGTARVAGGTLNVVPTGVTLEGLEGAGTVHFGASAYACAISGDADCGISASKTYTHLANFALVNYAEGPAPDAVVNGVTFTNYWTLRDRGAVQSVINIPNSGYQDGTHAYTNPQPGDSGIKLLVRTMSLGSTAPSQFALLGLEPGKTYDFRFYFRPYGKSDRRFTFRFLRSGVEAASINWDPNNDAGKVDSPSTMSALSVVGCRYTADASGRLDVRMEKYTVGDGNGMHYYAFSNERVSDSPADGVVTLAPAAGERRVFSGNISAESGLVLSGTGQQDFGKGANLAVSSIALTAPASMFGPAAYTAVPVDLADGSEFALLGGASVGGVTGSGILRLAFGDRETQGPVTNDGTFGPPTNFPRSVSFTDDETCGVSAHKDYLFAADFGRSGTTVPAWVNGVRFTASSGTSVTDTRTGVPITLSGLPVDYIDGLHQNIRVDPSQSVSNILESCNFGTTNTAFVFKGLTPGETYEARFYFRSWGDRACRDVVFSYDPDGSGEMKTHRLLIDSPNGSPFYEAFRFTAVSNAFPIYEKSFDPNTIDKIHIYAGTLEKVGPDFRTLCVSNDCSFAGAVNGFGGLLKSGPAKQTFTGAIRALAPWTVAEGTLELTDAEARLRAVCVAGGVFGGVGTIEGDLGVTVQGTLRPGVAGAGGTLNVLGRTVIASGAVLDLDSRKGVSSKLSVGDLSLGQAVTVILRTDGKPPARTDVLNFTGNVDGEVSDWTVVDETGRPLSDTRVMLSNGTLSVYRTIGTILHIR